MKHCVLQQKNHRAVDRRRRTHRRTAADEPLLALVLADDRSNQFSRRMLTPNEIARSRAILQHTHIDWAALGYDDGTLDELVEFPLAHPGSSLRSARMDD